MKKVFLKICIALVILTLGITSPNSDNEKVPNPLVNTI